MCSVVYGSNPEGLVLRPKRMEHETDTVYKVYKFLITESFGGENILLHSKSKGYVPAVKLNTPKQIYNMSENIMHLKNL